MLDDDVRHAAVGVRRREERFQGLDAARRCSDSYDRKRISSMRGDKSAGAAASSGTPEGVGAGEDADSSCSLLIIECPRGQL